MQDRKNPDASRCNCPAKVSLSQSCSAENDDEKDTIDARRTAMISQLMLTPVCLGLLSDTYPALKTLVTCQNFDSSAPILLID